MGDTGVQVVRWRRYGKDRLYVNDAEGRRLGWVDVITGAITVEVPEQRAAVEAAAVQAPAAQLPRAIEDTTSQRVAPDATEAPAASLEAVPAERAWRDLSLNRPG